MKNKKAIKELRATTEQLCQMYKDMYSDIQSQIETLFNERLAVKASFSKLQSDLKTIAKHVQNLEAEKGEKCSCHIEKPKAEFDNELFSKLFIYNFEKESKQVNIDAINQAVYSGHSIIDIMEKYTRNAVANATAKTIADIAIHTNTQKTDKNATEGKEEGKKQHSETIVTNEMFNEELKRFLSEGKPFRHIQKYTSMDNSLQYIGALIYDLYAVTEIPDVEDIMGIIRSKLKSKGEHYNKIHDRYANFKDALARNKEEQPHLFANWTVVDKINSYKDKHVQWLIDTRGTKQTKTDLQEAYIDVICYCIMCYIYLKFNGEAVNG